MTVLTVGYRAIHSFFTFTYSDSSTDYNSIRSKTLSAVVSSISDAAFAASVSCPAIIRVIKIFRTFTSTYRQSRIQRCSRMAGCAVGIWCSCTSLASLISWFADWRVLSDPTYLITCACSFCQTRWQTGTCEACCTICIAKLWSLAAVLVARTATFRSTEPTITTCTRTRHATSQLCAFMAWGAVTATLQSTLQASRVTLDIAIRPAPSVIANTESVHTFTVISAVIKANKISADSFIRRTFKDYSVDAMSLSILASVVLSVNCNHNFIVDSLNYLTDWFVIVLYTTTTWTG